MDSERLRDPLMTRRAALGVMGALALPWGALRGLAQPMPPAETDSGLPLPDLANHHALMEWLAVENAPRMTFPGGHWGSLDEWKTAGRAVLRDRLAYEPSGVPLAVETVAREERGEIAVESVRISATPAYSIPAKVLVPRKRPRRLPAVLALHCHSGRYTWGHEKVLSFPGEPPILTEFRNATYGRPWAEELARRGHIVVTIDAFYFGERRLRVEELEPSRVFGEVREHFAAVQRERPGSAEWTAAANRVCGFYEHLTAKTILATGATWPGIHVWDDMRTVDYLMSRPDVDPDRIGCAGLSGGGFRTAMLIGSDPRIKAAVVAGWMTEFAGQLRNHARHTWMVFVPGMHRSLDLPDIAGMHAPGALLVQQCRKDRLFPLAAMEASVAKLEKIYAKAGVPGRFRGVFHDVPHSFMPAMQDEAFDWFERWL